MLNRSHQIEGVRSRSGSQRPRRHTSPCPSPSSPLPVGKLLDFDAIAETPKAFLGLSGGSRLLLLVVRVDEVASEAHALISGFRDEVG